MDSPTVSPGALDIGCAVPQVPLVSDKTAACIPLSLAYRPTAAQYPGAGHDTEGIAPTPFPASRATRLGTVCGAPHVPPTSPMVTPSWPTLPSPEVKIA